MARAVVRAWRIDSTPGTLLHNGLAAQGCVGLPESREELLLNARRTYKDAGDGVGVGDDLEDPHAAATFSAAGDALREDAGEELCPGDAPGSGRGRGRVRVRLLRDSPRYIFRRDNQVWSQEAYIKASNPAVFDNFGVPLVLSADGNPLAVGSNLEDSAAIGVGGDQATSR